MNGGRILVVVLRSNWANEVEQSGIERTESRPFALKNVLP